MMYVTNQSNPHTNFFLWYWMFDHSQQSGVYQHIHYPSDWDWFIIGLITILLTFMLLAVIAEVKHA